MRPNARSAGLSGLYMARHEAGSCEAWHTNCAPYGPRAFSWQVCQPASQTNHSLAVDQKSGCTDGNVLFCALMCIHYVYIILLNLNKWEKSEVKWEKTCPCLQILSLYFEIIFPALAWNNFQYTVQWYFVYVDVQYRKC